MINSEKRIVVNVQCIFLCVLKCYQKYIAHICEINVVAPLTHSQHTTLQHQL